MLARTECSKRECRHLRNVIQPDGTEMTERWTCAAFPEGIPEDIAYGDDLHLVPQTGDHGIVYEQGSNDFLNER